MEYYSSFDLEKSINDEYLLNINKKQKELDELEKDTGKPQKYTAFALIKKSDVIFIVKNNKTYFMEEKKENLINEHDNKIKENSNNYLYKIDEDFDYQIEEFIKKYPNYKITFQISKYGSTVYYDASDRVYPAILEAENGEKLVAEDINKYEFIVN